MSEALIERRAGGLRAVADGVDIPRGCFIAAGSFAAARARAREQRMAWLPVQAEAGWVLIGPAVRPGVPGCPTCLHRRRDSNRADAAARQELTERHGDTPCEPRLLPMVSTLIAALLHDEVTRGFSRTSGAVLQVCARTGAVTSHRLIADPLCPDCGHRPDDVAAPLRLGRAPKPAPSVFRVRPLPVDLERRYVDPESGLLGSLGRDTAGDLPTVVARRAPGRTGDESRHGYGRAFDVESAKAVAIAEALERHACTRPRGRRPVVRACFADIAGHALDPRMLGLYPDSRYNQSGFSCTRFDVSHEADWVWGYSFARSQPVMVPLNIAYYGAATEPDTHWVRETSNGAAIGGCLAEAIFYGLLEIAERDAFLMTWYGRLPVPKVDLATAADRRIPLLAAKARQDFGYELMAFATPMEQRVPAFWAMAVDRVGGNGRPYALCAAGAHPDPGQALRAALLELLPSVARLGERYDETASAAMLADDDLVREMGHHRLLYCHPDARHRLEFLPADGPGRPLGEVFAPWPAHEDLTSDLAELAGRYLASGLDVIAVDTTPAELSEGGFSSAKVVVPGTLPMTFGHRYRRTHGLPRLLTVPRLLGYADRDLHPDELNPHPHPFP